MQIYLLLFHLFLQHGSPSLYLVPDTVVAVGVPLVHDTPVLFLEILWVQGNVEAAVGELVARFADILISLIALNESLMTNETVPTLPIDSYRFHRLVPFLEECGITSSDSVVHLSEVPFVF